MKTTFQKTVSQLFPAALLVAFITIGTHRSHAGWGKKIDTATAPAAVIATIKKFGGHLDEIRTKDVDGETLYRAEIERPNDSDVELYLKGDGTISRQIDEVKIADVPEPVKKTAKDRLPEGTDFDDVTVETVDGKKVYVVEVDRESAADLHLHIAADGTFIEEIEETDD